MLPHVSIRRYFKSPVSRRFQVKVHGQGKLNMRIISESVLMPLTQNYQNQSMLDETTASQSWLVFLKSQCTYNFITFT